MFFGAAKKVAQVAGFVEADNPELELVDEYQDEVSLETAVAAPVKVSSGSIKQVGKIAPYVVDPQEEYNKLAELFGVFSANNRRYAMSCPGCFETTEVEALSVDMQQDCLCPECGTEDTFDMFFDKVVEDLTTSRTPTLEEAALVIGIKNACRHTLERIESTYLPTLRVYYGLLNGVGSLVEGTAINNGLHNGRWMQYCSSNCNENTCGHGCDNGRMKYYGKLKSLQEALAEQEED